SYRAADQGTLTLKDSSGKAQMLVFGEDYLVRGSPLGAEIKLTAPLVFAGFGVVAPEHGRDDYAGVDVKGKIVVLVSGAPKSYQTEERAYYGNFRVKAATALAHGAIGIVTVETRTREKLYPFPNQVRQYQSWGVTWRDSKDDAFVASKIPTLGSISVAGAAKLFAGSPMSADQILTAAETPDAAFHAFDLPISLDATLHSEIKKVESENVVGVLPGSDPKLKDEFVVLSAHLDHLGITPPVNGDSINNGALDNASGVATTLEVARLFRASGKAPKRSLLFLIDTAEEKGLIGAGYFAENPTVPKASIAADVDLDMPILTYDFSDVVAFGADRSSIGPVVKKAAGGMKVGLSPDPMPDEGIFTRSDHYRFVEQGVPAVFLITGFGNGGEAAFKDFMANHYHKPSDDLSLPIRYDVGAKFARLNYEITKGLADSATRPAWNKGDFFAEKFAGH
ncbi:MAG TPA: M28 family metallopeptidase, partial [Magnetospirillaceae bacterium]|nr:M28 family metallopeptidase [Magnetospirillaceae bacterium]